MRSIQVVVIPAGTNAGGVYNSAPISIDHYARMSVQAVIAGGTGIVGVLKAQFSNDVAPSGTTVASFVPPNWTDLGGATTTITGNTSGGLGFSELSSAWLRIVWTPSAGNRGTIKATCVIMGWD